MKPRLAIIARTSALLFALATLWSLTRQGHFEPSRLDVAHFEAGAGDILLLIRAALATIAAVLLLLSAFSRQPLATRLCSLLAAVLIIPVFIWSAVGRERWAPHFDQAQFAVLSASHHLGGLINEQQILAALGQPLMTDRDPTGAERWSYSYMPSSGFGWHKRIVTLRDGAVVRVFSMDEP